MSEQPVQVEIVDVSKQVLETVAGAAPAQPSVPPKTTLQEDITLKSQREISKIWELTQAAIALMVVGANMFAALWNVVKGRDIDVPLILSSALFLVVGAYFQRVNHQNIGGIGRKANEEQPYRGR